MKTVNKVVSTIKTYRLLGSARLVRDIVATKVLFPNARIVRWPFYIRNRGTIEFGQKLTTGVGLRIDCLNRSSKLVFGNLVQINDYCHIGVCGNVTIGSETLIASKVMIMDHNHGSFASHCEGSSLDKAPISRPLEHSDITIGDKVWIGESVLILSGVSIGSGAVIGAGSVVTKDIEPNSLAVGNPARVIKKYDLSTHTWHSV